MDYLTEREQELAWDKTDYKEHYQTIKGIWLDPRLIVNPQVQIYLRENYNGLFIDHDINTRIYADINKQHFPNSLVHTATGEWEQRIKEFEWCGRHYIDEPFTCLNKEQRDAIQLNKQIKTLPNLTIGEIGSNLDNPLFSKKSLTYTAYKWFLFRVFNHNIYMPFSNQLTDWIELEKAYPNRFRMCWIHIKKNKNDFKELVRWVKNHSKEIWLFAHPFDYYESQEFIYLSNKFLGEI